MNDRVFDIDQVLNTKVSGVSESLHKLADQFDQENANLNSSHLKAMSVELQRIAWSSLFVSTTIENVVDAMSTSVIAPNGNDHTTLLRQIDGLHVAVKYLAQSVRSVQARRVDQSDQERTIDEALKQFAEKLLEVAGECKCAR
jgi:phosphoglycolate phosphatase-like HAD superfamily hydrolase